MPAIVLPSTMSYDVLTGVVHALATDQSVIAWDIGDGQIILIGKDGWAITQVWENLPVEEQEALTPDGRTLYCRSFTEAQFDDDVVPRFRDLGFDVIRIDALSRGVTDEPVDPNVGEDA